MPPTVKIIENRIAPAIIPVRPFFVLETLDFNQTSLREAFSEALDSVMEISPQLEMGEPEHGSRR